jgi:hypothetical protein
MLKVKKVVAGSFMVARILMPQHKNNRLRNAAHYFFEPVFTKLQGVVAFTPSTTKTKLLTAIRAITILVKLLLIK